IWRPDADREDPSLAGELAQQGVLVWARAARKHACVFSSVLRVVCLRPVGFPDFCQRTCVSREFDESTAAKHDRLCVGTFWVSGVHRNLDNSADSAFFQKSQMRSIRLSSMILFLFLSSSTNACVCEVFGGGTPRGEMHHAKVVFIGELLEIREGFPSNG